MKNRNNLEQLMYIESMKCATKEENLTALIFLNYYDLCVEQHIVNDQILKYLDIEMFKRNGFITEENIRDFLYLISDEKEYLYDIEKSDYFTKQDNGYILNTEKFIKENKILKEIFIFNGYIDGVSLSTILKQLNSFKKLTLNERLLYSYIIDFGHLLSKKEDEYFIDSNLLTNKEINIMNEIYNKRNKNKILNILYSLKDKFSTEEKVKIIKNN